MKIRNLLNKSREYTFFTVATMLSAGVHFIFSIYAKRSIEPLEYGIYSTCVILQTYMTYFQLGSMNAFNRDYPQLIGAKDYNKAKAYRETTLTLLLIMFGLAVIITFFITFVWKLTTPDVDIRYSLGYFLCAIIAALSVIESFGNSRTRIDGNFIYNAIVLIVQLFSVPIGILLIQYFGYYALYFTTIISLLIGIAMFYKRGYSDVKLQIDRKLLKELILTGMPLLINGLVWTVVNTIDKFVILGFLETEALGVYGIAQNAFSFIVLIPNALSNIFYVRMGREYGATGEVQQLNKVANNFTSILAVFTSFIAIGAFFLIPPFVRLVVPKYVDGIASAQILVVALAIYAPTLINGNILTILKKNAVILRLSVYLCIFNILFSILFILFISKDISSVAYGTAVAYILYS
ncbi:MAG: oligosaccharide flippase family protein, partial [Clostridiales bacterium]|nr:oligosaccharide flippase family protein [Clostridiales bacterium]